VCRFSVCTASDTVLKKTKSAGKTAAISSKQGPELRQTANPTKAARTHKRCA